MMRHNNPLLWIMNKITSLLEDHNQIGNQPSQMITCHICMDIENYNNPTTTSYKGTMKSKHSSMWLDVNVGVFYIDKIQGG
jgi:hypothetical protein